MWVKSVVEHLYASLLLEYNNVGFHVIVCMNLSRPTHDEPLVWQL